MNINLAVIGLVVSDMNASLTFYRKLGLDISPGAESEPHVEAVLPSGLKLAFDTVDTIRSFDPEWTSAAGGHRIALAFGCANPSEVDECYTSFVADGYDGHLAPWDAFWGQRYAVLHDPDGNAVELFAALDVSG